VQVAQFETDTMNCLKNLPPRCAMRSIADRVALGIAFGFATESKTRALSYIAEYQMAIGDSTGASKTAGRIEESARRSTREFSEVRALLAAGRVSDAAEHTMRVIHDMIGSPESSLMVVKAVTRSLVAQVALAYAAEGNVSSAQRLIENADAAASSGLSEHRFDLSALQDWFADQKSRTFDCILLTRSGDYAEAERQLALIQERDLREFAQAVLSAMKGSINETIFDDWVENGESGYGGFGVSALDLLVFAAEARAALAQ
jgi:hypothetical protein